MRVRDLPTPALVVDLATLDRNITTMGARWPGERLRPHVKAFKSTSMARRLTSAGHAAFCCATAREVIGMANAGLGHDLLLANELLDADRLRAMANLDARVTVAVDSTETIAAAAAAGIREVLIDVDVGLPRCGCAPEDAGRLAEAARANGLSVRGVMGYEGHLVLDPDRHKREAGAEESMRTLQVAHQAVGGDVVSGGGTGTWDINTWVTELQAGSFTLMDTAYEKVGVPFEPALAVVGTVLSVKSDGKNRTERGATTFAAADVGAKAVGMDHGNPSIRDASVWYCSDEHVGFSGLPTVVGDRVLVWPAHIDPTVALHERFHVVERFRPVELVDPETDPGLAIEATLDQEVVDHWEIDLRGW